MEGERLGRYRLVRKLATGGMAEVFLAVATGPEGFEKVVVVKRVLHHLSEDPRFVEMFLDEARLAARLEHPNIVQIFDLGEVGGRYFIAMEYLRGLPVSHLLRRTRARGQEFPHPLAALVVSRAASALHYAHRLRGPDGRPLGIVHRDISPDNLFVTREGVVKVLDFGIAKAVTNRHETTAGTIKGKFAYMSPEQVRGQRLDARSDVFSLGVVLYELTTSVRPFEGTSDILTVSAILNDPPPRPMDIFPGYDPALEAICLKCLAKDPDQRWASAGELAAALSPFVGTSAAEEALASMVESLATDEERLRWEHPVEKPSAPLEAQARGATLIQGSPPEGSRRPDDTEVVRPEPRPPVLSPGSAERTLVEAPLDKPAVPPTAASATAGSQRGRKGLMLGIVGGLLLVAAAGAGVWVFGTSPQVDSGPASPPVAQVPPAVGVAPQAESRPTRLVVRSVVDAIVEVDGRVCGVGRCERETSPGPHRVRVRGHGYQREQEVDLPEGRTTEVEVMPPPGSLRLKVPPGVEAWLDGERVGRAPFVRPIQTWQGVHTLRLVPPRGDPVVRTVVLTAAQPEVTVKWP